MKAAIFMFLLCVCHINGSTQQTNFDIHFVSDIESKYGMGWPHELSIMKGQEALLKLRRPLVNMEKCLVTTAKGVTFDVATPPGDRFERWGDGCGVRLKEVAKDDEGHWRLTAIRGSFNYTGFSKVTVIEATLTAPTQPIELEDGTKALVNLTVAQNTGYCVVTQPFAESSLVPGECFVNLDRTTRAIQGEWSVVLGVTGRVSEYSIQRRVSVEAERMDVGFIHDRQTNKIHLFCNILNTHKNVSFCRFQVTSKHTGYNVLDGMSDGMYSYYGDGFFKKHCGLTVEHPTPEDFGSWRCSVGVSELVGATTVQRNPMQALISVTSNTKQTKKVVTKSSKSSEEIRSIFVQKGKEITINCRAEVSLSYCWFQGADGKQYSPIPLESDNPEFWYSGEGLSMGDCGITFTHATDAFTGQWTCHMGPRTQLGLELTDILQVHVSGALAAYRKEVQAEIGETTRLYCLSASGNRPLSYCRFLSPAGLGLNMDSSVTSDRAILGRYYFTPGRMTNHGDCSIDIRSLTREDAGNWTCAALVSGEVMEARDTIVVNLKETETLDIPRKVGLSTAGVIGMVVGIIVLGIVLGGFLWYKRFGPGRNTQATMEEFSMERSVAPQSPRSSNSSEETSASNYVKQWFTSKR